MTTVAADGRIADERLNKVFPLFGIMRIQRFAITHADKRGTQSPINVMRDGIASNEPKKRFIIS